MPRTLTVKNLPLSDLAKGTIVSSAKRLEKLAVESGWQRRQPKKLDARDFVHGMLAMVLAGGRSFREMGCAIGMRLAVAAGGRYDTISKVALWKRVGAESTALLKAVLAEMVAARLQGAGNHLPAIPGILRIIVEDSSQLNLDASLAGVHPGPSNQHNQHDGGGAGLKLQAAFDLLTGEPVRLEFTAHRRNDKSAALDIIPSLRPGDLAMRDLGYHGAPAFTAITGCGAHYLSRHLTSSIVRLREGCETGARIDLLAHLREHAPRPGDTADIDVAIGGSSGGQGSAPLHTRLVARRVPHAVEEKRLRRLGQEEKRRGKMYSKDHRALQGWEIYITSLPREDVSAATIFALYPLRWRVEIIFKACKGHTALEEIAAHRSNSDHVQTMLHAWLIGLVMATRTRAFALAVEFGGELRGNYVSLLKVVRKVFDMLRLVLDMGAAPPRELIGRWRTQVAYHDRYERRRRRTNATQNLEDALWLTPPGTPCISGPDGNQPLLG